MPSETRKATTAMTANPGPQIASMIEYLPVDLPIANETAITSATAASEQPSTVRNTPVGNVHRGEVHQPIVRDRTFAFLTDSH